MRNLVLKLIGTYLNLLAIVAPRYAGKKGFELFCRPLRAPVREHHLTFLNSAETFSLRHGKVEVKGYKWGSGPRKIILLHGWQSHTFRWKSWVEALLARSDYSIYAVDAPGHGLSDGNFFNLPMYGDVIEDLLLVTGPVHAIIGHSMGSFATLLVFHRRPLMVDRLVLLASPGEASEFVTQFNSVLGLSHRARHVILNHFVGIFGLTPEYFSAPAFAKSVHVPGLLIHDEGDPDAPYQHAKRIHESWKESQLITTTGLGHNLRSSGIMEKAIDFIGAIDLPVANRTRMSVSH